MATNIINQSQTISKTTKQIENEIKNTTQNINIDLSKLDLSGAVKSFEQLEKAARAADFTGFTEKILALKSTFDGFAKSVKTVNTSVTNFAKSSVNSTAAACPCRISKSIRAVSAKYPPSCPQRAARYPPSAARCRALSIA